MFAFCWSYVFHIWDLLFCLFFVFHTEIETDINRLWTGPKLIPHLRSILFSVVVLRFCMMLLMSQTTNLCTAAVNLLQFGLHSYRQKLPFFGAHQHCVNSSAVGQIRRHWFLSPVPSCSIEIHADTYFRVFVLQLAVHYLGQYACLNLSELGHCLLQSLCGWLGRSGRQGGGCSSCSFLFLSSSQPASRGYGYCEGTVLHGPLSFRKAGNRIL